MKADHRRSGAVASVLRVLGRNPKLRRVELAYLTFTVAEWGTWLAMLVYAYDNGGVTETGVLATVLLVPAAIFAPVLGEIALLYDVPRTATVQTRSDARLYGLDRETFLVSLTGHASAVIRAHGLADERLAELQALRESRTLAPPTQP